MSFFSPHFLLLLFLAQTHFSRHGRPSFKINNCLGWLMLWWARLAFLLVKIPAVCCKFFLPSFQTSLLCDPFAPLPQARWSPPTSLTPSSHGLAMIYRHRKISPPPASLKIPPSPQPNETPHDIERDETSSEIEQRQTWGHSPRATHLAFLLRGF